jgi:hypothetical protein
MNLQKRVISLHAFRLLWFVKMIGALIHHVVFPLMGLCSKLFGLGMLGYFVYASSK